MPLFVAILFFVTASVLIYKYHQYSVSKSEKSFKSHVTDILVSKKSALEKALYSRIYYTKGVASYVSMKPEISDEEFTMMAGNMISGDSVISTISIAKDCRISMIFPYKGHEEAIGLDLLDHPQRREIVENTITTGLTFVAGPVELVEGGIAFISYTPIFIATDSVRKPFWGMTDIVIKRDQLFSEAGLFPEKDGLYFSIKGEDGKGDYGSIFWGDTRIDSLEPISVKIQLPTGSWVLSAVPVNGWDQGITNFSIMKYSLLAASLIISILIWQLIRAILKIRENENELKGLFFSMNDLVIEFNPDAVYTNIAPANENLLFKPRNEMLGKSVYEIFPKDKAELFHNAIRKCYETKNQVVIDYPLAVGNKNFWFRAKVGYISENRIIFIAHDNTDYHNKEQELLEANATKDKFFSIIAHDLKNPIGSFVSLAEYIEKSYDDMNKDERMELIDLMKTSAKNVYSLLENLLNWSRSQRGVIPFNPEITNIRFIADNVVSSLSVVIAEKDIIIENKIDNSISAYFDSNMIITVLRNLLNNAVKFTPVNGSIILNASESFAETGKMVTISVLDTGVGMKKDIIDKLFRIDENISTPGTNNEKGTGLGLILAKEFVEKNGGNIRVTSKPGEGSNFIFTLPAEKFSSPK